MAGVCLSNPKFSVGGETVNRKLFVLVSMLVFASMVLSACGGAGQASNKTITIAYTQEPDNVAAEYSNMTYSAWLDQVVGASLVTWEFSRPACGRSSKCCEW